tara:strand:+ start:19892 stop:20518 length:627 start_codon:yes stop_codon:yes gene_type:complete
MTNLFSYFLFLTLVNFNVVFADNIKVAVEKQMPLAGGKSTNKNYLQTAWTSVDQLSISYFLGENKGIYFGLNYSKEFTNHSQRSSDTRPDGDFTSNFVSIGPEVGFWVQPADRFRIEMGLFLGAGDFKFSGSDSPLTETQYARKVDFHMGAIYSSAILGADLPIDFIAKYGIYKVFLNEFTYNNITYTRSELDLKFYLYFCLGVGLRF